MNASRSDVSLVTRRIAIIVAVGISSCVYSVSQVPDVSSVQKNNLELLQQLIREAAFDIVAQARIPSGQAIHVEVQKSDDSWIIEQQVSSSLKNSGYRVFLDSAQSQSKYLLILEPLRLQVQYEPLSNDGIFSQQMVRRQVTSLLAVRSVHLETSEVLLSTTITKGFSDTVAASAVSSLEIPRLKSTQGVLPDERWLDRVLEPFVIIGATGIAVFLFFHIRS